MDRSTHNITIIATDLQDYDGKRSVARIHRLIADICNLDNNRLRDDTANIQERRWRDGWRPITELLEWIDSHTACVTNIKLWLQDYREARCCCCCCARIDSGSTYAELEKVLLLVCTPWNMLLVLPWSAKLWNCPCLVVFRLFVSFTVVACA